MLLLYYYLAGIEIVEIEFASDVDAVEQTKIGVVVCFAAVNLENAISKSDDRDRQCRTGLLVVCVLKCWKKNEND